MNKKIFFVFLLTGLIITSPALAHNPRIVDNQGDIISILNPDISQAFYGELNGDSALFSINLEKDQDVYFGILVPDLPNIQKDKSVVVVAKDQIFVNLDGESFNWTKFHEEFANDNYFTGPEEKVNLKTGEYLIVVSSPNNLGKYVLVVGEKESFTLKEIWNTIITLPTLKKDFFLKSSFFAFTNKIGLFIFGPIILLIATITTIIILRKKK